MVKIVLGELESGIKGVVPCEFEGYTQHCEIDSYLNTGEDVIQVPAIYGSFDKILTKQGMCNIFHVAFLEKRTIYLPLETRITPHSFKEFLNFLNFYTLMTGK